MIDTVPNTVWERVAGGHPEEWRTRQVLNEPPGCRARPRPVRRLRRLTASLITYSRIEDLRATNESFVAVPLVDPRHAGGPLVDDPTARSRGRTSGPA